MKIIHICPYFAPAWGYGGTPKAVFELALAQVKAGHEVTVLTTDVLDKKNRIKTNISKIKGIKVIRLKNLNNWLAWNLHQVTPYQIFKIPKLTKFQIIHLHEIRTFLNLFVLIFLGLKKQQLFISPWGTLAHNHRLVWLKKLFDLIFKPLLNQHNLFFLGQNKHELKTIQHYYPQAKFQLLPLGVNPNDFVNLPTKAQARKFFKLKQNEFVFVYLGRISAAKGLKLLIESFEKLASNRQVKLLIIGRDDGYLAELKNLILKLDLTKQVQIFPPIYGKKRFLAYKSANCFISTQIADEETSTTCLEALGCGTQVITTKQAEIPGLKNFKGLFQVIAKQAAVIQAMNKAIKTIQTTTGKTLLKQLSWKNINQQLLNIYEKSHHL